MFKEGYREVELSSGKAWILYSKAEELQKIDTVFFDCDGVLVDVRESYHATVIETVKLLTKRLTGLDVPYSLPLRRGILELKKCGAFNNDWAVSYALLLGIYSFLPRKEVEPISSNTSTVNKGSVLLEGFQRDVSESSWQRIGERIMSLNKGADSTGLASVEKALIERDCGQFVDEAKKLLGYPLDVSIVARVIDEIFYGPQLFREKFKIEPEYYKGRGFFERDIVVISRETLSRLSARVGKDRIGIISGRDIDSAKKTLSGLLDDFEPRNLLFLMVEPSYRSGVESSEKVLNKPDPEILLRVGRTFGRFQLCLYAGDSGEDLIMVQRANAILPRFVFAGVYESTDFKDEVCSHFLKMRADIVVPSINDLPEVLDILRRR